MTPLDLMTDPALWGGTFGGPSWRSWRTFVAAASGLAITDADDLALLARCTGRETPPARPARTVVALCGRRSGKSLTAAFLATAHAILAKPKLAPGERPIVLVCATDMRQAKVIHDYVAGLFAASPLTAREVVARTASRIELRNGTAIEIRSSDFRRVRGVTCLAAVVDEACFLRDEQSSVPDLELYRALKPALVTTGGPFIAISSPWSRRGLLFTLWKKHWARTDSDTFVWVSDSRTMNITLDATLIAEAMADDPVAARSEWQGLWREDLEAFLSEEQLEAVTVAGRGELGPVRGTRYTAFLDMSGGSQDSSALCVAHAEPRGETAISIVDHIDEVRPPFDADEVTARFAATLTRYGLTAATSDKYSGTWIPASFARHGITVEQNAEAKTLLYTAFLPLVTSRRVELPDDQRLLVQLASLERRVRAGGKDVVDHPPGGHDDRANVVAGATVAAAASCDTGPVLAANLAPEAHVAGWSLDEPPPLVDWERELGRRWRD